MNFLLKFFLRYFCNISNSFLNISYKKFQSDFFLKIVLFYDHKNDAKIVYRLFWTEIKTNDVLFFFQIIVIEFDFDLILKIFFIFFKLKTSKLWLFFLTNREKAATLITLTSINESFSLMKIMSINSYFVNALTI